MWGRGEAAKAKPLLEAAATNCDKLSPEYDDAVIELKRLVL